MPTYDRLIRYGMITPNICLLCLKDSENQDHLFWNCERVKEIWVTFLGWFNFTQGMHANDIHSLLVKAWQYELSPLAGNFWKAGIITVIWAIWTQRNNCIFDNQKFEARRVIQTVKVAFKDIDVNFSKLGYMWNSWSDYLILRAVGVATRSAPPPEFVEVHWWPPVAPWIKVNTDGSAMEAPGNIAAGRVFHDNWNVVRGCFHFKGGSGYAFEAELLAIISAIQIANRCGWHKLWIEADSTYVVSLLNSRSSAVPWRFKASWNNILEMLEGFSLQVTHIFREGNKAADIMANQKRLEGWWPHEIEEIKAAVRLDMASHSHLRLKC
ncbi:uncharacterized protein LOC131004004 [Salvia miltiorrhiza]|uniref:uncharacterized protein LOC131004004 n=1 Tax=Salvia miltiorrhiza TaxID=226208 RepID=UPI0025AC1374|nr:uncharacterized protein LOC131004004 [Salvia miltiorrhiza]